jgi:hypothetical protein
MALNIKSEGLMLLEGWNLLTEALSLAGCGIGPLEIFFYSLLWTGVEALQSSKASVLLYKYDCGVNWLWYYAQIL